MLSLMSGFNNESLIYRAPADPYAYDMRYIRMGERSPIPWDPLNTRLGFSLEPSLPYTNPDSSRPEAWAGQGNLIKVLGETGMILSAPDIIGMGFRKGPLLLTLSNSLQTGSQAFSDAYGFDQARASWHPDGKAYTPDDLSAQEMSSTSLYQNAVGNSNIYKLLVAMGLMRKNTRQEILIFNGQVRSLSTLQLDPATAGHLIVGSLCAAKILMSGYGSDVLNLLGNRISIQETDYTLRSGFSIAKARADIVRMMLSNSNRVFGSGELYELSGGYTEENRFQYPVAFFFHTVLKTLLNKGLLGNMTNLTSYLLDPSALPSSRYDNLPSGSRPDHYSRGVAEQLFRVFPKGRAFGISDLMEVLGGLLENDHKRRKIVVAYLTQSGVLKPVAGTGTSMDPRYENEVNRGDVSFQLTPAGHVVGEVLLSALDQPYEFIEMKPKPKNFSRVWNQELRPLTDMPVPYQRYFEALLQHSLRPRK